MQLWVLWAEMYQAWSLIGRVLTAVRLCMHIFWSCSGWFSPQLSYILPRKSRGKYFWHLAIRATLTQCQKVLRTTAFLREFMFSLHGHPRQLYGLLWNSLQISFSASLDRLPMVPGCLNVHNYKCIIVPSGYFSITFSPLSFSRVFDFIKGLAHLLSAVVQGKKIESIEVWTLVFCCRTWYTFDWSTILVILDGYGCFDWEHGSPEVTTTTSFIYWMEAGHCICACYRPIKRLRKHTICTNACRLLYMYQFPVISYRILDDYMFPWACKISMNGNTELLSEQLALHRLPAGFSSSVQFLDPAVLWWPGF